MPFQEDLDYVNEMKDQVMGIKSSLVEEPANQHLFPCITLLTTSCDVHTFLVISDDINEANELVTEIKE